ncbi:MAG: phage tail tape measure protein, partial [Planctomycetaceae bacterium]
MAIEYAKLVARFSADTTDLARGVTKAQQELSRAREASESAARGMRNLTGSMQQATASNLSYSESIRQNSAYARELAGARAQLAYALAQEGTIAEQVAKKYSTLSFVQRAQLIETRQEIAAVQEKAAARVKAAAAEEAAVAKLAAAEVAAAEKSAAARAASVQAMRADALLAAGALAALGAASIKLSVDFNKSMAHVATLIPGNTERVLALKDSVQQLAVDTGKSTKDLSQGLFQVISAFGDTADSVKLLEIANKAAIASDTTTEQAVKLLTSTMKAYGEESAAAAQKVSDLAFKTDSLGVTTVPELASSIGKVTPLAKNLGVSMQEMFATMATGAGVTGDTAQVSTQLRGILASLLNPTTTMSKLYEQLGVKSGAALIKQRGLQGAINAVKDASDQTGIPLQKFVHRVEAMTLILALAGPQANKYTKNLNEMANSAGAADKAHKEVTEGINKAGHEFDKAKEQVAALGRSFGDLLTPFILDATKVVSGFVKGLQDAGRETTKFNQGQARAGSAAGGFLQGLPFGIGGIAAGAAGAIRNTQPKAKEARALADEWLLQRQANDADRAAARAGLKGPTFGTATATTAGPRIIEGNAGWGVQTIQAVADHGLATPPFLEIC